MNFTIYNVKVIGNLNLIEARKPLNNLVYWVIYARAAALVQWLQMKNELYIARMFGWI